MVGKMVVEGARMAGCCEGYTSVNAFFAGQLGDGDGLSARLGWQRGSFVDREEEDNVEVALTL